MFHPFVRLLPLLAVAMLMVSCKEINQTFTNHYTVPANQLRVTLKFPSGTGTFPSVESWYKGRVPTITSLGGGYFLLVWDNLTVRPGDGYHVGCVFEDDQDDVEVRDGRFAQPHGGVSASQQVYKNKINRAVTHVGLTLYNEAGFLEDATIKSVQWAPSKKYYPLGVLDWDDPAMEELSWQDAPDDFPYTLAQGEERSYALDIDDLGTASFVLVRWIASSPHPTRRGEEVELKPVIQTSVIDLLGVDAQAGK